MYLKLEEELIVILNSLSTKQFKNKDITIITNQNNLELNFKV